MENEEIDRIVAVGQANITSMLLRQQSSQDVDLNVFDGNPLGYHNLMTLFHKLVEKRADELRGRLTRLIRYKKGDPKDMI